MAISDAPDGTLWVQQVSVSVDVPEPPETSTDELLEDIKDLLDTIETLITTIAAWGFSSLASNVSSVKSRLVPTTEEAAGDAGRYTGTDTTYQTVASWTVEAGKTGELKEITILSDDYDHTQFKITVGGITFETDWAVQGAMPLIFEDLRLAAGSVVKVECKSTDGTSITVDAVIVGRELT